ncbi:MAG: GNAT family N-acetyltransferase [Thiohalocapsa sp.]
MNGIAAVPPGAGVPLAAMHRACFPDDPWDADVMARILALAGTFGHLAWQGDDLAGFILARDLGGEVEILSLGVLPAWRRRGIGRALLDAAAGEAVRRDAAALVLEVATDNEPASRLYAAFGFTIAGRRPRYYRRLDSTVDAFILRREIIADVTKP